MSWLVIVRLTIKEAVRRRLMLALFGLSAVAVAITAWGYAQLNHLPPTRSGPVSGEDIQIITSLLLILVMFMFSFVLGLSAVFAAAPSVAGELESGEALVVLARPVSRASVLLGKWVGLAVVIVGYAVLASLLEFGVAYLATGYWPPHPLQASAYLAGEGLVLLSLTLLLSTRLPALAAGIVAMLLFGLAWLAGVVGGIGYAFGDPTISRAGTVGHFLLPTDGLWRGAIYAIEPTSVLIAGSVAGPRVAAFPFYAPGPPSFLYLAWCVAWLVGVLALAVWSFARRDV
jgi:ABC-type transport system involved in multi-copper enzyme maturation permease subunit